MAKQQRGSSRTPNRPVTPASSSGKPPASGQKSGQKSSSTWQPNKVTAGKKSSGGLNRTGLITIGAIIVGVLIVAVVAVNQLGGSSSPKGSAEPIVAPGAAWATPSNIPTDGLTLGDPNAKATIDLWGDFRCSACYQYTVAGTGAQVVSQLVATGKAKLVWHDFLVIDLHDKATASRDAANAARCGADQNKFWTMHDWLYANQSITEDPSAFTIDRLLKIGAQAGLDTAKYNPCVTGGTHLPEIATEQSSIPSQVTGTPTIFVNGTLVETSFDKIKAAVDAAQG